jgi:serine/threonine-protein kinase
MSKVLIADDNTLTLRAVQVALEVLGFDVVATSDPARVVELAAAHSVDAIVLDVLMPGLSGFDVMHLLRTNPATAGAPVVLLSGLGEGADRVRGLREGADDYLVKPFEPAELGLRLERLIARRRAGRELAAAGPAVAAAAPQPDISAAAAARLEAMLGRGEPLANVTLGRYQILSRLGEGATGTVLRAWDARLQRTVALKTVRLAQTPLGAGRDAAIAGLLREAVAAARVQHPNIVSVHDVVDAGPLAFIIMEFVNGIDLGRYLCGARALDAAATLPLAAAVARPLAVAHANRVIHRDLKPANVLLGRDGSVKVGDFGIAGFLSSLLTEPGRVFGTPGFVPPECLAGGPYDEKGDLFALGVTLYLCRSGIFPFAGATLAETIRNTMERDPPRPPGGAPPALGELDDLVMAMISRERSRRPASAAMVAAGLERLAERHGLHWAPSMAVMERAGEPSPAGERLRLIPTTPV